MTRILLMIWLVPVALFAAAWLLYAALLVLAMPWLLVVDAIWH